MYVILAGVPGVARDDEWRNLIAFFSIGKQKGVNILWKCVTAKHAQINCTLLL
jgi:hypothetical protein